VGEEFEGREHEQGQHGTEEECLDALLFVEVDGADG